MRSCESCVWSFIDNSVGDIECTNDDLTEEEIVKYYENAEDGCPHYKEEEDLDYMWICALDKAIEKGHDLHFVV